jgi:tRNA(fMet)-specific endonuclease VapC
MLILDTDHFSELIRESDSGLRLSGRLGDRDDVTTTIITIEEQSRGWLARIKQARRIDERVRVYDRFHHMVETTGSWRVLK